jgi:pyruvate/2-oxoglutarate dehydrogenase complex dihydrolipoamide acyltransferase (E2) component
MDIVLDKAMLGDEEEAEIKNWLVEDGAAVTAGQPLVEIETGKAVVELAAEKAGRIEVLARAGAVLEVNSVIGRIA